jgi:hypothetical protein
VNVPVSPATRPDLGSAPLSRTPLVGCSGTSSLVAGCDPRRTGINGWSSRPAPKVPSHGHVGDDGVELLGGVSVGTDMPRRNPSVRVRSGKAVLVPPTSGTGWYQS